MQKKIDFRDNYEIEFLKKLKKEKENFVFLIDVFSAGLLVLLRLQLWQLL